MSATPDQVPEDEGRKHRRLLRALDILAGVVGVGVVVGLIARFATPWGRAHRALLLELDLILLGFFVTDVVIRLLLAEQKLRYLRSRWFDLVVLVPLTRAMAGVRIAWLWYLARQVAVLSFAVVWAKQVQRVVSQLWLHPARLMVGSFAAAILVGALLLMTPDATTGERSLGFTDALFTATSATCVTGLVVKDTGSEFTLFGQLVILLLIQLGGLGIMTFSVSVVLALGRQISKRREVVMQDMLDEGSVREVLTLVRFIVMSALVTELLGAIALFFFFAPYPGCGYTIRTAYLALFHSVSAFCNAGFSLFSNNLTDFRTGLGVNLVITTLIIIGGLGFPVLRDLLVVGARRRLGEGRAPRLRTQTKVVLATTAVLIVAGAAVFFVVQRSYRVTVRSPANGEYATTEASMTAGQKLLACYFQSVTARTAGFNTIEISEVGGAGLLLLICLMFIGASPGSTGGGIKTTTAAVLFQAMRSTFRGRTEVEFFHRTIPPLVVRRALALAVLSLLLLLVTTTALLCVEKQASGPRGFEKLAFEAVSAFGTVGLSAGATPELTDSGKLLITMLMFIGRIGPLTMALLLIGDARPATYRYPETRIMVG
jgi:trk system potassium uptake protein TrkH